MCRLTCVGNKWINNNCETSFQVDKTKMARGKSIVALSQYIQFLLPPLRMSVLESYTKFCYLQNDKSKTLGQFHWAVIENVYHRNRLTLSYAIARYIHQRVVQLQTTNMSVVFPMVHQKIAIASYLMITKLFFLIGYYIKYRCVICRAICRS